MTNGTSNFTPQLPETAHDVNSFLNDDKWCMSQKMDGERCVLRASDTAVMGYNRSGEAKAIDGQAHDTLLDIPAGWTFDGEMVNDTYYVFDLLEASGKSLLNHPFTARFTMLEMLLEAKTYGMVLVPHYFYRDDKIEKYAVWEEEQVEGAVFKRVDKHYSFGRSRWWRKAKFVKDVDCVVTAVGVDGKNNLELSVYDGETLVSIGKVSALTGDGPNAKVGDVVKVNTLYATNSNRLYQPTKPRIRTDKTAEECTMDQVLAIKTNKAAV